MLNNYQLYHPNPNKQCTYNIEVFIRKFYDKIVLELEEILININKLLLKCEHILSKKNPKMRRAALLCQQYEIIK